MPGRPEREGRRTLASRGACDLVAGGTRGSSSLRVNAPLAKWERRVSPGLSALVLCACGAGLPTFQGFPPRAAGVVGAGVGTSTALDLDGAGSEPAGLLDAAFAEDVAAWAEVDVGLGARTEASLTYAGSLGRLGARHAWLSRRGMLSVGSGFSARLPGAGEPGGSGTLDASRLRLWMFDVPVVASWRSDLDVVVLWAGVRGRGGWLGGEVSGAQSGPVRGAGWGAGALAGLAVGAPPFWAAVELDVERVAVDASVGGGTAQASGFWQIVPAGALLLRY